MTGVEGEGSQLCQLQSPTASCWSPQLSTAARKAMCNLLCRVQPVSSLKLRAGLFCSQLEPRAWHYAWHSAGAWCVLVE